MSRSGVKVKYPNNQLIRNYVIKTKNTAFNDDNSKSKDSRQIEWTWLNVRFQLFFNSTF